MAQSISQEAIGATGLPGATAASRHAGATASGAPVSGTFAVGDYIIDQTGKVYVCTVAGTPGTWVQTGGGAAAPGTTVSSFISSAVSLTTANTVYNVTSITLTTGTWLINYMGGLSNFNSGLKASIDLFLTTTSASSTGTFTGTGVSLQAFVSGNVFSVPVSGVWSYVAASTTTIYLCAVSSANTGQANSGAQTSSSNVSIGASGLTAVRTA